MMVFLNVPNPVLFFCFATAVQAYTTFQAVCAPPTTPVNFVSSPDTRGTLDILWSSFFIIFACTWTIQHSNVPEQRDGRDPGLMGDLKWKLKRFYTSGKWMVITILAPELIVGMACRDLTRSKEDLQKLQGFATEDQVPWTLAHTYYANMGGFVIRSGRQRNANQKSEYGLDGVGNGNKPSTFARADPISSIHQQDVALKQSESRPNIISNITTTTSEEPQYCNPFHLDAYDIYRLRSSGEILKLPSISAEELDDKSKSDVLLKAIALVQIIWALLQITVRAARGLAISQLELAVIAFSACAILIYALYWAKPKNVCAPTTILHYDSQIPSDVLQAIESDTVSYEGFLESLLSYNAYGNRHHVMPGSYIRNDSESKNPDDNNAIPTLAMLFAATMFGGIHVAAWNFDFPTSIEITFWRCASVICAAFGLSLVPLIWISDKHILLQRVCVAIWAYSYVIARLFLIVEMFRTLCFLPPGAYIATWTSNIPHIG